MPSRKLQRSAVCADRGWVSGACSKMIPPPFCFSKAASKGFVMHMTFPRTLFAAARVALALTAASSFAADVTNVKRFSYPAAPRADVVDDYHGTKVADPYRPLEDPDSAATRAWVEAENKITFGFLEKIAARGPLKERLTRLWDYEKFTELPFKEGGRYFYIRNSGLQNQSVLYTTDSLDGDPKVLLDPNTLSADGTVALVENGRQRRRHEARLRPGRRRLRLDHLESPRRATPAATATTWSSGASSRSPRGPRTARAFSTAGFPSPSPARTCGPRTTSRSCITTRSARRRATTSSIYERPDQKDWEFGNTVTDDGKYLVIDVSKGTDDRNRMLYKRSRQARRADRRADREFRRRLRADRQRRAGVLLQDEQGRAARPRDRHRHAPARRGELEGDHPPGRRDAALRYGSSATGSSPTI